VTVVSVAYICCLTLHRSRKNALCCVVGHVYVVKPKEKGYAPGLQHDVMV
jgi:hypothetical protein